MAKQTAIEKGKVVWTRNHNFEAKLDSLDVTWEYIKDFPIESIDDSGTNGVRLYQKTNPDVVADITHKVVETGLALPALVITDEKKKNGHPLLGGYHRCPAIKAAKIPVCDVYMVKGIGPSMADVVGANDNSFNGQGQGAEERLMLAVRHAKNNQEESVEKIADMYGVKLAKLKDAIKIDKFRTTMTQPATHVPHSDNLTDRVVLKLAAAKTKVNDPVLFEMARALAKYKKVSELQAKTLIDAVLAADPRTDENMRTILLAQDQLLHHQLIAIKCRSKLTISSKILMEIHRTLTLTEQLESKDARDIFPGQDERKEFAKTAKLAIARLQKAIKQLKEDT